MSIYVKKGVTVSKQKKWKRGEIITENLEKYIIKHKVNADFLFFLFF